MSEIEIAVLVLATVFGAITSFVLGWLESKEPFDVQKFAPSFIRAVLAGIIVAMASVVAPLPDFGVVTVLTFYLAGLGFDAGINRLSGVVQKQ